MDPTATLKWTASESEAKHYHARVDHPKVWIEQCSVLPSGRHAIRKVNTGTAGYFDAVKPIYRVGVTIATEHDDLKLDDWEAETGLRPHPDRIGPYGILLHIGPCPDQKADQTLASEVAFLNQRIEEAQETGHYELVTVLTAQLDAVQKLHIGRLNDRGDYAD